MTKQEIKRCVGKKYSIVSARPPMQPRCRTPRWNDPARKTEDGFRCRDQRPRSKQRSPYLCEPYLCTHERWVQIGRYRTYRLQNTATHHNPSAIRKSKTYMDPNHTDKSSSELASRMESIGRFINSKIDVFHIESTINNRMFAKPLDLGKTKTNLVHSKLLASNLVRTLNFLPQSTTSHLEKLPPI